MTKETRRLEQMQALTASRSRVTEVLLMMVPLVEQLANNGHLLARYVVEEFERAWDIMASENMSAREYLADEAENGNTP